MVCAYTYPDFQSLNMDGTCHYVGSVCYLNIMGQSFVFLNTYEAAVDLLEKRGSIYSDRMQYVMATDL